MVNEIKQFFVAALQRFALFPRFPRPAFCVHEKKAFASNLHWEYRSKRQAKKSAQTRM